MNLKSVMTVGASVSMLAMGINLMAWGTSWNAGGFTHYNFNGRTGTSWNAGGFTHYNFGGRTGTSWNAGGFTHYSGDLFRGQEKLKKTLFADKDFVKKADAITLQKAILSRDVDTLTSCAWDLKGLEIVLNKKDGKTTSKMLFNLAAKLAVEQSNAPALKAIVALAPECKKFEAQLALKGKTRGMNAYSVTALPQLTTLPQNDWEKALQNLRPWEQPVLDKYLCASFRGMPASSAVNAFSLVNNGRFSMNPQMIAIGALELSKYPYDKKLGSKFEPAQIFAEAVGLAIFKQDKGALAQIIALYGTANFKNADYAKYLQNELSLMSSTRGFSGSSKKSEPSLIDFSKTIWTVYYDTPDFQVK